MILHCTRLSDRFFIKRTCVWMWNHCVFICHAGQFRTCQVKQKTLQDPVLWTYAFTGSTFPCIDRYENIHTVFIV